MNSYLWREYDKITIYKEKIGSILYFADQMTVKSQDTPNLQYTEQEVWGYFVRFLINSQRLSYFSTTLSKDLFIKMFDSEYGSLKHNGIYTGLRLLPLENSDQEDNQADDPMTS